MGGTSPCKCRDGRAWRGQAGCCVVSGAFWELAVLHGWHLARQVSRRCTNCEARQGLLVMAGEHCDRKPEHIVTGGMCCMTVRSAAQQQQQQRWERRHAAQLQQLQQRRQEVPRESPACMPSATRTKQQQPTAATGQKSHLQLLEGAAEAAQRVVIETAIRQHQHTYGSSRPTCSSLKARRKLPRLSP